MVPASLCCMVANAADTYHDSFLYFTSTRSGPAEGDAQVPTVMVAGSVSSESFRASAVSCGIRFVMRMLRRMLAGMSETT